MTDSNLSSHAKLARNEATATMLRGGSIEICGGNIIDSADEATGERPVMAKIALPDSRVQLRADRTGISVRGIDKAEVLREGLPVWWRGFTKAGVPVVYGLVYHGAEAKEALAKIDAGVLVSGMIIDVDRLWRGMNVELGDMRIQIGEMSAA